MDKAYAIYDKELHPYDGNAEVIYAKDLGEAVRKFCLWMYGGEGEEFEGGLVVQRVMDMDKYKGKSIPKIEFAKIRWLVTCDGCGETSDDTEIVDGKVYCDLCEYGEAIPTPLHTEREGE